MSETKKKTPAEKAASSRFAWAEKGDPYSALDFTILLLKNPKVKPPGFTDKEVACYKVLNWKEWVSNQYEEAQDLVHFLIICLEVIKG